MPFGGLADENGELQLYLGEKVFAKVPIYRVDVHGEKFPLEWGFMWITNRRVVIIGIQKPRTKIYASLNPVRAIVGTLVSTAIERLKKREFAMPILLSELFGIKILREDDTPFLNIAIKDPKNPTKVNDVRVLMQPSYLSKVSEILMNVLYQGKEPLTKVSKPAYSPEKIERIIKESELRKELGELTEDDFKAAITKLENKIGKKGLYDKLKELKLRFELGEFTKEEYEELKRKLLS